MKNPLDPRHLKRERLMFKLFSWQFLNKYNKKSQIADIIKHIKKIDKLISGSATQWPINQLSKIDLAILRLAVYELVIIKKEPEKVIIDEAVELAKKYGGDTSPGFINGVLGTVIAK